MHRRHLLQSLMVGLPLAGFGRVWAAPQANARLLVVFLRGGYDAANVVAPISSDFYYAARPTLALAKPDISVKNNNGVLEVSSPVYCHGVHIEDGGHEVLADNYFDLLPGVPRHVAITAPNPSGTYSLSAVMPIEAGTK